MAKYFIDGVNGSDSNNGTAATTPWKTLTKWKTAVFAAGLMTTSDEVVVSGLVREPTGVTLDCIGAGYAAGSRYMQGIRQWNYALDGPVGTVGTQTEQDNSILRARFTSAAVLAGSTSGGGASVATLTVTNLGTTIAATDTLGYLTYKYYRNIDKYGRHYGHFLQKTGSDVAANGSGDYRYLATGAATSTITCDGTSVGASPTITDFEYTRADIGAIILFQNWEGFGVGGPALLDGITLDRAIHRTSGAYLASMESCQRTGFRNCVGFDGGHHGFGITGSASVGCWLDNVHVYGLYGLNSSGGQGGNSMASSGVVQQTNAFTYTASGFILTGTFTTQQCPLPGTVIEITQGTGATVGATYTVAEATSSTSFKLTTAIAGVANGANDIKFKVRNRCDYNLVQNFDYHIYPPLGLLTTSNVAAALANKNCIGLSNSITTSSFDAPSIGNIYRKGKVTMYPATLSAATASHCVGMGNRCSSYASDPWNADTYPLLIEDVTFTDVHILSGLDCRDVAFRRCNIILAPSAFTAAGSNLFGVRMAASNSGANVQICRILLEGTTLLGNMALTGASHGALVGNQSSTGNNQTAWTWTLSTLTLSKAGALSNCPPPPVGAVITITGGTGTSAPQTAAVVSATTTSIVLDRAITATDGAADIAFDVCMAEFRAANSTILCTSGDFGLASPVVTSQTVCYDAGPPASLRGAFFGFRNCILGFDRTSQATNQNIFQGDTNQSDGSAFGARRVCQGCVYVNHTSISQATGLTTNANFLNRSTGVDRTGFADGGDTTMNGCLSGAIFPNSHLATSPPAPASSILGGSNRRRSTGAPGAWQFGRSLDDLTRPRGRGR